MGGEWASGAALVSETWPAQHRGKALGLMQSAWAIGYGLAAAVTMVILPVWGWRAVFFVGVLPALLTFWVRRYVKEPEMWVERQSRPRGRSRRRLPRRPHRHHHRRDDDECVHALRVVGLQPVVARVSLEPARGRRHRPDGLGDVLVHHRDAGGHVARLHHLRLHQRRHRAQAYLCHVSRDCCRC